MPEDSLPKPPSATFERIKEFMEAYSNNVRFESTVVDLRIIFGQSDLQTGSEVVKQHTSITVPWPMAKLMIYYLAINVIGQETQNGTIQIPPIQVPPPIEPPTEELRKGLINPDELYERLKAVRELFLSGKML
jgi:hypothetical protein